MNLDPTRWQCVPYRTFDDLAALMARHIAGGSLAAVVHCAAVSDYLAAGIFALASPTTRISTRTISPGRMQSPTMLDRSAGKVKSDEPELWLRLTRAPKLVDQVRRDWSFTGILVKFKLEVGVSDAELLAIAERSRQQSSAAWLVANTLEGAADWAFVGSIPLSVTTRCPRPNWRPSAARTDSKNNTKESRHG